MRIKVLTNIVHGGWSARELETGIGGSEEMLIMWAEYMAKEGNDVQVYMNGEHGVINGVEYLDHREFNPTDEHDVFISFKAREKLDWTINSKIKLHWSHEIEPRWHLGTLLAVNSVITLSEYHRKHMTPESKKFKVLGNFFDKERMDRNKVEKEQGSVLYCSSFDRGLEELLKNWTKLQKNLGVKKLYVTYGWDFIDNLIKANPQMSVWKKQMQELMKQDGIVELGRITNDEMCKMYYKCEYWALPLNNPQSELFCINALKAQYAGCIPLVRRIGALQETVNEFLDWDGLMGQKVGKSDFGKESINSFENNKKFVEQFEINNIMKKWNELLKI